MTEPSQYFKGRTVQEQMNEVIGYVDTRAAEVATDAIAADVAQVHQDMLDADADASAAAASAAAAAGTLANAVKKTGEASQSIAGDIAVAGTLSGGVVTGTQVTAPTPVNNTDAANKKYVDDQDALAVPILNVNNYAVGLTGNQVASGLKFMYAPYYIGSPPISEGGDSDDYVDLANLGPVANGGNVAFMATSRYGFAIGGFTISNAGVPTFAGTVTTSAQRTSIGITVINGDMHLVAKRTSTAGQTITMIIFGCSRGAGFTPLTPSDTYQTINIANTDYNEGVQI